MTLAIKLQGLVNLDSSLDLVSAKGSTNDDRSRQLGPQFISVSTFLAVTYS